MMDIIAQASSGAGATRVCSRSRRSTKEDARRKGGKPLAVNRKEKGGGGGN